jgi:hypothetical protein
MRSLTVEARDLDGARSLCEALAAFKPSLTGSEADGYRVAMKLGSDQNVVAVLNAIERYVAGRTHDPARLELDGHRYTLDAN